MVKSTRFQSVIIYFQIQVYGYDMVGLATRTRKICLKIFIKLRTILIYQND